MRKNEIDLIRLRPQLGADPNKAFALFQQATRDQDSVPLRHRSDCYRNGIGCDPDHEQVTFIEEWISVREQERKPTSD